MSRIRQSAPGVPVRSSVINGQIQWWDNAGNTCPPPNVSGPGGTPVVRCVEGVYLNGSGYVCDVVRPPTPDGVNPETMRLIDHHYAILKERQAREDAEKKAAADHVEQQRQRRLNEEKRKAAEIVRNNRQVVADMNRREIKQILFDEPEETQTEIIKRMEAEFADSKDDPNAWTLVRDSIRFEAEAQRLFNELPVATVRESSPATIARLCNTTIIIARKLLLDFQAAEFMSGIEG